MRSRRNREYCIWKKMLYIGVLAFVLGALWQGSKTDARVRMENEEIPQQSPEVTATPIVPTPIAEPTPYVTPVPVATPTPAPNKYVLQNPSAKYKKDSQTGIHYKKVKGKKVYHITSYTTDSVKLVMSHASIFTVYGGGSKKEVKNKDVTVSSQGIVKCHRKKEGQKRYTIIQAESKLTGEKQYIYIYFKKKLICKSGKKLTIYEKKSQSLSFNYAKQELSFSVANKKIATISKKGKLTVKKKGTTYVIVKVKDSEKNKVKIKIVVKREPWIVNDKDTLYSYVDMTVDLRQLAHKYAGKVGLSSLGKSHDNRELWYLRLGNVYASKKLVINAAIHAREWKNSQVIMRQTEEILRNYSEYRQRFQNVCIYIIPMDNPDGVSIAQYGYSAIRDAKLRKRVKKIGHFKRWKNNARGVNLNNNFPAGFKKSKRVKKPDWVCYSGKKAGSEKETKALMQFIKQVKPTTVINLHSTGSVIYWDFNVGGALHQKLYNLAKKIHSFNGYQMMPKSPSTNKAGGFADWLVYDIKIPSVTIETGTVHCPLPHSQYKSIYKKNNKMFTWFFTKY